MLKLLSSESLSLLKVVEDIQRSSCLYVPAILTTLQIKTEKFYFILIHFKRPSY